MFRSLVERMFERLIIRVRDIGEIELAFRRVIVFV